MKRGVCKICGEVADVEFIYSDTPVCQSCFNRAASRISEYSTNQDWSCYVLEEISYDGVVCLYCGSHNFKTTSVPNLVICSECGKASSIGGTDEE